MARHSKNATSAPFYSYHERKKIRGEPLLGIAHVHVNTRAGRYISEAIEQEQRRGAPCCVEQQSASQRINTGEFTEVYIHRRAQCVLATGIAFIP